MNNIIKGFDCIAVKNKIKDMHDCINTIKKDLKRVVKSKKFNNNNVLMYTLLKKDLLRCKYKLKLIKKFYFN